MKKYLQQKRNSTRYTLPGKVHVTRTTINSYAYTRNKSFLTSSFRYIYRLNNSSAVQCEI